MKIKLIKPYLLGDTLKPEGKEMDVTRAFAKQLIEDGIALPTEPQEKIVKKPHKTK